VSESKAVFLSYGSEDSEAAVRIADALKTAGIEVWFDKSELRGGDIWDQDIRRQIRECRLFIPLISANTQARLEGYFRREWNLAVDRTEDMASSVAFIVPVAIDDTLEATAEVPERFRQVQWIRLRGGETSPEFVERIQRLLFGASRTGGTASYVSGSRAQPPVRLASRSRRWRWLLWPVIGLSLAMTFLVVEKLGLSKFVSTTSHPAPPTQAPSRTSNQTAADFNPPPHSIAVLPFVNMSGDPKQEYFSDGITEEMINALAQVQSLKVTARTSAFSFKGQNVDIGRIARALNVAAILEGSIRHDGNKVRITAQLINAVTGYHIWSQNYDRDLHNILALQTDVARTVAGELQAKLNEGDVEKIASGGTQIPAAHDAYLQGLQLYYQSGKPDYRGALAKFDEAIERDPHYARAYARRAGALLKLYTEVGEFSPDLYEQARVAAEHAVRISPDEGEAHLALALTDTIGRFELAEAEHEFEVALKLSPGSSWIQGNYATFSSQMGRPERAIAAANRAIELDPRSRWTYQRLYIALLFDRRYQEAFKVATLEQAVDPRTEGDDKIEALYFLGRLDEVRQICEDTSTVLDEEDRAFWESIIYHALGNSEEASAKLNKFSSIVRKSAPYQSSRLYAQLGDDAAALKWLDDAVRLGSNAALLLRFDPFLDPIRNKREFKLIVQRIGFP
jgi:TolB-like protein/Tfp pilus assembly protein PilF